MLDFGHSTQPAREGAIARVQVEVAENIGKIIAIDVENG